MPGTSLTHAGDVAGPLFRFSRSTIDALSDSINRTFGPNDYRPEDMRRLLVMSDGAIRERLRRGLTKHCIYYAQFNHNRNIDGPA